ncbi:MAG: hypothetical protein E7076_04105 [Bacteroidales bacterium]|nr:hypothetical protein [Bacteroidales bacterium]
MNVLFVTGHPAQVHNFRLVRQELIKDGHNVFWLTTPKDIATNLLDIYGIPYTKLQKAKKSLWSRMYVMLHNTIFVFNFLKKNKIDICITRTDPYTAIAAKMCGIPNIMLQDTEHAAISKLQGPFAKYGSAYLEPDCFSVNVRPDEQRFPGNIELFYCHPNRYKPQEPWSLLGIAPNTKYAIVRFVKWDAFHDENLVGGFSLEQKIELINRMKKYCKVYISSETELPSELEDCRISVPIERIHDVQANAFLFVGESATMASESVVLGTPSIYIDEVGRGYTDEEAREGLLWMYRPVKNRSELNSHQPDWISGGVEECIDKTEEILSSVFDIEEWNKKHQQWMRTKFDCTAWLTWYIENYPQSKEEWNGQREIIKKRFI